MVVVVEEVGSIIGTVVSYILRCINADEQEIMRESAVRYVYLLDSLLGIIAFS